MNAVTTTHGLDSLRAALAEGLKVKVLVDADAINTFKKGWRGLLHGVLRKTVSKFNP